MGAGMNAALASFVVKEFRDSRVRFVCDIHFPRTDLCVGGGLYALVTMQSWMFLSSLEA